jgi:hypothetical protein
MGWQLSLPFGFGNRIERLELDVGSARGKPNGTEWDGRRRFHLRIRGDMGRTVGRTERTSSARNNRRIRAYVRCLRPRIGYVEQGQERPRKQRLPPVCAPVTADTRRQSATSDDRASGAQRHVAMAPDTTRHHPTRRMGSPKPQGAGWIPVPPAPFDPLPIFGSCALWVLSA